MTEMRLRPELLANLACVVTDCHFGEREPTGLDLLTALKGIDAEVPVVLASYGEFSPDVRRRFDRFVSKMAVNAAAISLA